MAEFNISLKAGAYNWTNENNEVSHPYALSYTIFSGDFDRMNHPYIVIAAMFRDGNGQHMIKWYGKNLNNYPLKNIVESGASDELGSNDISVTKSADSKYSDTYFLNIHPYIDEEGSHHLYTLCGHSSGNLYIKKHQITRKETLEFNNLSLKDKVDYDQMPDILGGYQHTHINTIFYSHLDSNKMYLSYIDWDNGKVVISSNELNNLSNSTSKTFTHDSLVPSLMSFFRDNNKHYMIYAENNILIKLFTLDDLQSRELEINDLNLGIYHHISCELKNNDLNCILIGRPSSGSTHDKLHIWYNLDSNEVICRESNIDYQAILDYNNTNYLYDIEYSDNNTNSATVRKFSNEGADDLVAFEFNYNKDYAIYDSAHAAKLERLGCSVNLLILDLIKYLNGNQEFILNFFVFPNTIESANLLYSENCSAAIFHDAGLDSNQGELSQIFRSDILELYSILRQGSDDNTKNTYNLRSIKSDPNIEANIEAYFKLEGYGEVNYIIETKIKGESNNYSIEISDNHNRVLIDSNSIIRLLKIYQKNVNGIVTIEDIFALEKLHLEGSDLYNKIEIYLCKNLKDHLLEISNSSVIGDIHVKILSQNKLNIEEGARIREKIDDSEISCYAPNSYLTVSALRFSNPKDISIEVDQDIVYIFSGGASSIVYRMCFENGEFITNNNNINRITRKDNCDKYKSAILNISDTDNFTIHPNFTYTTYLEINLEATLEVNLIECNSESIKIIVNTSDNYGDFQFKVRESSHNYILYSIRNKVISYDTQLALNKVNMNGEHVNFIFNDNLGSAGLPYTSYLEFQMKWYGEVNNNDFFLLDSASAAQYVEFRNLVNQDDNDFIRCHTNNNTSSDREIEVKHSEASYYLKMKKTTCEKFSFHHSSDDKWNMKLIFEELSSRYQAEMCYLDLCISSDSSKYGLSYTDDKIVEIGSASGDENLYKIVGDSTLQLDLNHVYGMNFPENLTLDLIIKSDIMIKRVNVIDGENTAYVDGLAISNLSVSFSVISSHNTTNKYISLGLGANYDAVYLSHDQANHFQFLDGITSNIILGINDCNISSSNDIVSNSAAEGFYINKNQLQYGFIYTCDEYIILTDKSVYLRTEYPRNDCSIRISDIESLIVLPDETGLWTLKIEKAIVSYRSTNDMMDNSKITLKAVEAAEISQYPYNYHIQYKPTTSLIELKSKCPLKSIQKEDTNSYYIELYFACNANNANNSLNTIPKFYNMALKSDYLFISVDEHDCSINPLFTYEHTSDDQNIYLQQDDNTIRVCSGYDLKSIDVPKKAIGFAQQESEIIVHNVENAYIDGVQKVSSEEGRYTIYYKNESALKINIKKDIDYDQIIITQHDEEPSEESSGQREFINLQYHTDKQLHIKKTEVDYESKFLKKIVIDENEDGILINLNLSFAKQDYCLLPEIYKHNKQLQNLHFNEEASLSLQGIEFNYNTCSSITIKHPVKVLRIDASPLCKVNLLNNSINTKIKIEDGSCLSKEESKYVVKRKSKDDIIIKCQDDNVSFSKYDDGEYSSSLEGMGDCANYAIIAAWGAGIAAVAAVGGGLYYYCYCRHFHNETVETTINQINLGGDGYYE